MLTLLDPGRARTVVRLHSYEVFTPWPQLVDFSRVDDLVFVSDHVRELTMQVVPSLRTDQAPRTSVLGNAMDLHAYVRPKAPSARFTAGLVGVSVPKDPRWAAEVLRLLRRHDDRYRLLLVGTEMDPGTSGTAQRARSA